MKAGHPMSNSWLFKKLRKKPLIEEVYTFGAIVGQYVQRERERDRGGRGGEKGEKMKREEGWRGGRRKREGTMR